MSIWGKRSIDARFFPGVSLSGDVTSRSEAGVRVDHDSALSDDAVLAAVSLLAGDIAGLPMKAYVTDGELTQPLDRQPSWIEAPDPLDVAITDVAHKTQVALSVLLAGNGYVFCEPDVLDPVRLTVLNPLHVRVRKPGRERLFDIMGRSSDPYSDWTPRDVLDTLTSTQILHIPYLLRPGRLEGLSPIAAQTGNLGISLALRKWMETFFGKGGQVPGFVSVPSDNGETVAKVAADLNQKHGGWRRAGILGALGGGAQWVKTGLSPQDADLSALWRRQKEVVASIYGIPPFMVGSQEAAGVAYASVVDRREEYKEHCLSRYTRPMEKAYSRLVPGDGRLAVPGSNTEVRFVWEAFLRADPQARANFYHTGLGDKWLTVDWVRSKENLPPMSSIPASELDGPGGLLQTPNNNTPGQTPPEAEPVPAGGPPA